MLVPATTQLVCPAGVAAVIHPTGATSKYLHAVPQAEPVEVKGATKKTLPPPGPMSPMKHTPPVAQDNLETVVTVESAAFLVRATAVDALLEFSLDPPQAVKEIAATASSANFFDLFLNLLITDTTSFVTT